VGKSTLVQSFVSASVPSSVPRVVDAHLFRSDAAPAFGESELGAALRRVSLRLVDSDGGALARDGGALRDALVRTAPDVVLLCYSHADPGSLVRLAEYWLPELAAAGAARPGWPHLPVCLCGLKVDAFDDGARDTAARRRVRARARALLTPLRARALALFSPQSRSRRGARRCARSRT